MYTKSEDSLIIEAGRTKGLYWKDLWRYRELFYFLAWRDILVRYKQTVIGIAWSIIRPLSSVIVSIVDFCFSFIILLLLMADYKFVPSLNIILE